MKFNKLNILLFAFLLSLTTCKKEESSFSCECEELPNADFTISKGLGLNDDRRYFESDTLLKGLVKLEAVHPNLIYKWKIGTDPTIRVGKKVELDYDFTGNISVTLTAEWTPRIDCFPNDNGNDSVTKTFHLVNVNQLKIFGEFEGYFETAPDSLRSVYVEYDGFLTAYVNNIPLGCFENDVFITGTYRNFFMPNFDTSIPCSRPKGWGKISEDDKTLTLEYEIWNSELGKRVNDKFIGTKK